MRTIHERAAWHRLARALRMTRLPAATHGALRPTNAAVRCEVDDFSLMHVQADGNATFKNIITRQHLYLLPSGALAVPTGAAWCRGVFQSARSFQYRQEGRALQ